MDILITRPPMCLDCKHYDGHVFCSVYPSGIPEEILSGQHDHRKPYKGDNGIRFEPIKEEEK